MRALISAIIATSILVSACTTHSVGAPERLSLSLPHERHERSALHVEGRNLRTADGRDVQLRGVNLGGWLVTEAWMCGFEDSADDEAATGVGGTPGRHTLESLEGRFGEPQAARLIEAWRDNWVTAKDLDRIRDAGFNLVRVPISYRTLQHEDGSWIVDSIRQIDFSRMDWIVREAAQRGIYVIFDLHVWPEQRFSSEKIGRPDGRDILQSMSRLWAAIASHYRGEGAIAAFDLINEFPGAWGVQQVLAEAVQREDPSRLQVIEGFTLEEFLTLRASGKFPNGLFSEHLYGPDPLTTGQIASRLKGYTASPVPVYIGEFLAQDLKAAASLMEASGISWSSWTYKTVDGGDWSIFTYYSSLRTDIQKDSYEIIMERWGGDLISWQKPGSTPNSYWKDERVPARSVMGPPVPPL